MVRFLLPPTEHLPSLVPAKLPALLEIGARCFLPSSDPEKIGPRKRSVGEHVVVVWERIPGLWIVSFPVFRCCRGRSPRRHERRQSTPQVDMNQDLLDSLPLINHRNHPHPVLAMGANQRVGVPNFENNIAPFFGRQLCRRWRRAGRTQRIRRNTPVLDAMPLAAHFVRIPAVVTDHLHARVGNVLGDRCQEVGSCKNLEIAVDLRIQFGAVDDLLASGVKRHFGHRKRVARMYWASCSRTALFSGGMLSP